MTKVRAPSASLQNGRLKVRTRAAALSQRRDRAFAQHCRNADRSGQTRPAGCWLLAYAVSSALRPDRPCRPEGRLCFACALLGPPEAATTETVQLKAQHTLGAAAI